MRFQFVNLIRIFKGDYLLASLTMVAITIPLSIFLCNVFIATSILIWLNQLKKNSLTLNPEYKRFLFLFTAVYALQVLSMVNTDNFYDAWLRIESKLPYLIFPVIIFYSSLNRKKIQVIFLAFTLVIVFISSVCLILGFVDILYFPDPIYPFDRIQYTEFLKPFGLLPTYFSIYLSFIIFYLFYQTEESSRHVKIILWTIIIYLIAINMLVLSRGGLIAFFLTGFIYYFIVQRDARSISFRSIFLGIMVGSIFLMALFYIPNFKQRFDDMWINFENSLTEDKNESAMLHVKSWYCAIQLSRDYHFFTGYGTGDEGTSLTRCYEDHQWKNMTFNAHNEYLSNLLRHGVVGLIIFSGSLFWPLWLSYKRKDLLYMSFILLFSIALMTVSLSLQHGVVFYSFFNALLFKRMMLSEESKERV